MAKTHTIILADAKESSANPTTFHNKKIRKLGLEREFLSIIKSTYEKCTANITFNCEQKFLSSYDQEQDKKCPLLSILFNTVVEGPRHSSWVRKINKRHQGW